jgi:hypothetical protein
MREPTCEVINKASRGLGLATGAGVLALAREFSNDDVGSAALSLL